MAFELHHEIPEQRVRLWAMAAHLSAVPGLFAFPVGNLLLPVVVWLALRRDHPYIDQQAREAINYQASMVVYILALTFVVYLLKFIFIGYIFFWIPPLMFVALVVGAVIGAVRAYDGENFRYPLILRFL